MGEEGIDILIASEGEGDERLARGIFEAAGKAFKGKFVAGGFGEGFIIPDFAGRRPDWKILSENAKGVVFAGPREIFGRRQKTRLEPRRRMLSRRAQVDQLLDFSELCEGDYVVHLGHGICRYHGVTKLETGGKSEEVIKLEFEDSATLYLPLHKSYLLSRYIGLDKRHPKLSRLDSKSWTRIKTSAELAALDYAAELLEMQSRREISKGYAFPEDDDWQREFEDAFEFAETPDQLRAAAEVKADMESDKPMDRLLCADVGFGKTEVAMRAVFKCAMGGKQAAVLCPTTVLCQQHFMNFRERFGGYPIVVEMLSRFRTDKQQKKIIADIERGDIDLIIGTHRLLSSDIKFHNLGLLIVDEEQRFGVGHKESIKNMKKTVDVLTMSATPIPRTLHMSMVGIRDMSLLETPPQARYPVQTYVMEYQDSVIRDAILREIGRGGQVFFLYNRVGSIDQCYKQLSKLVPEARIAIAHGQMREHALEDVMLDFSQQKFDVLLCTTIIESGLDIPMANTLIIYDADHFGLGQLYQMRGRVGRSHHMAFAYFVYQADKILTETAEKRLQAMKEFAELGAGFKIAMRDLEIRGAGDLLGAQQHGHIASVGFEMYCKLLEEAVERLQSGKAPEEAPPEPVIDLQTEAYIDGGFITDAMHKIEIYQRIAAIRSNEELRSLLDELIDRFGDPTKPVMHLLEVARIKNYARELGIRAIKELPLALDLYFLPEKRMPAKGMLALANLFGKRMRSLPEKNGLRFALSDRYKKNITNFVTRVLMIATGDDEALEAKAREKASAIKKSQKGKERETE